MGEGGRNLTGPVGDKLKEWWSRKTGKHIIKLISDKYGVDWRSHVSISK